MKRVLLVATIVSTVVGICASAALAGQRVEFGASITSETAHEVDVGGDGFGLGDHIELAIGLAMLTSDRSTGSTGSMSGRLTILSPTRAHLEGVVTLRNGKLLVSGDFDPNAGSPERFSVRGFQGAYRGMSGDVAITENASGTTLRFSLKSR